MTSSISTYLFMYHMRNIKFYMGEKKNRLKNKRHFKVQCKQVEVLFQIIINQHSKNCVHGMM